MRRRTLAALFAVSLAAAATGATAASRAWNFRVLLDERPIGEHRFSLEDTAPGERVLRSDAEFAVKILGIVAYRYRHQAVEQWQGDCLRSLAATTDDDGTPSRVRADREGTLAGGCVMSFAYWNPALLTQTRLLNAQTGRIETVQVQPAGASTLAVGGTPVAATRYRIVGAARPIDVWYAANGDWIGLDAFVADGRKLSYRLP